MQRIFTVTCPSSFAATAANSLYGLISAITGAIPTGGILPDRCAGLNIRTPAANTGTVTLNDSNGANTTGPTSVAAALTTILDRASDRNTIDLRGYYPVGSAAAQVIQVTVDYK